MELSLESIKILHHPRLNTKLAQLLLITSHDPISKTCEDEVGVKKLIYMLNYLHQIEKIF